MVDMEIHSSEDLPLILLLDHMELSSLVNGKVRTPPMHPTGILLMHTYGGACKQPWDLKNK